MDFPLKCPQCGCDRFRFRLPNGKRLVGPINEKMLILINLLTDPTFKEPGEPNLLMIFHCAGCDWSFLKAEGVRLQDAFSQAK